jgi:hypothetical protein
MPFTISHIAAVLPGYRLFTRANIFTAAVIGSMVPDFGWLVPGVTMRGQTHSPEALFTFCLPVGLATYWLTLFLIRPAVIEVAPDGAYVRLRAAPPPASIRRLSAWLYAAAALLFGACTHLIWDAFTHENARTVRMFPALTDFSAEVSGHAVHLYRLLQYGSSLIGLVVVAAALILWLRHAPAPAEPPVRRISAPERLAWQCLYVLPPVLIVAWLLWRPSPAGNSPLDNGAIFGGVAAVGMRCVVASLLLVSALIRIRLAAGADRPDEVR